MKLVTDSKYYDEIARGIQSCAGSYSRSSYKPSELAEGVQTVSSYQYEDGHYFGYIEGEEFGWADGFDAGYAEGEAKGYCDGEAQGRQAAYDYFWDTVQENGNRTNYERAFSGVLWTNEFLKPKWDMKPIWGGATGMFMYSPFEGNLREHFENLNVTLDTSGLVSTSQLFYAAKKITEIPFLDLSGCSYRCEYLFYDCTALTTAHIKLTETVPISTNCFTNCTALANLTVDGAIGANISFAQSSLLTYESLMSIINALYDYSGTTETRTLTLHATAKANLSEADIAIGTQKGWSIV